MLQAPGCRLKAHATSLCTKAHGQTVLHPNKSRPIKCKFACLNFVMFLTTMQDSCVSLSLFYCVHSSSVKPIACAKACNVTSGLLGVGHPPVWRAQCQLF